MVRVRVLLRTGDLRVHHHVHVHLLKAHVHAHVIEVAVHLHHVVHHLHAGEVLQRLERCGELPDAAAEPQGGGAYPVLAGGEQFIGRAVRRDGDDDVVGLGDAHDEAVHLHGFHVDAIAGHHGHLPAGIGDPEVAARARR
jgi:hypothetical protein